MPRASSTSARWIRADFRPDMNRERFNQGRKCARDCWLVSTGIIRSADLQLERILCSSAMDLPRTTACRIGVQTIHRRTEPAYGSVAADHRRDARPWSSWSTAAATICCGSATTSPSRFAIFDPLLQLAQAAVRQPAPGLRHRCLSAAAASSDAGCQAGLDPGPSDRGPLHLRRRRGRRIPQGVRSLRRAAQRARRAAEREPGGHAQAVERRARVAQVGRFFTFEGVRMQPPPRQPGGPPIWCGGRSDAALRRIGRMTDGWMSYVVTPDMFRQGLEKIATAASEAGPHLPARLRDRASAVHAHRRHLRKGARCGDSVAQPALCHGLPQGRRTLLRARPVAAAWPRPLFNIPSRPARATSFSISSAPTRNATGRSSGSPPRPCLCWPSCAAGGDHAAGNASALSRSRPRARRGAGGRAAWLRFGVERRSVRHRRRHADRVDPRPHDAHQGGHRHHADAGPYASLHGDDGAHPAGLCRTTASCSASAPPGRRSSRAGTACRSASRWRARASTSRSCARS